MRGRCWCGVKNAWFSDEPAGPCGGTGTLQCYCGGDQCVCHNHGEVECDGCEDCDYGDGPEGDDAEYLAAAYPDEPTQAGATDAANNGGPRRTKANKRHA